MLGMDIIWTPEFAEAGWIKEWTGEDKAEASTTARSQGRSTPRPTKDKLYGAPFTTNAQLLWYRKDLVPKPPETWDEMIADGREARPTRGAASSRDPGPRSTRATGLVQHAHRVGGRQGRERGRHARARRDGRAAALRSCKDSRTRRRADPRSRPTGGPDAARVRGGRARLHAQLARLRLPERHEDERGHPKIFENMGGRATRAWTTGEPSRVTLGGINLGVCALLASTRTWRSRRRTCLTQPRGTRRSAATKGGVPPSIDRALRRPEGREAYPFADLHAGARIERRRAAARDARPTRTCRSAIQHDAASAGGHRPGGRRSRTSSDKLEHARRRRARTDERPLRRRAPAPRQPPPPSAGEAPSGADGARARRAQARLAALRAGRHRHARRRRLPDRLRDLPVAAALRPALPGRGEFVGLDNYVAVLRRAPGGTPSSTR